jgi:hypothetical protein
MTNAPGQKADRGKVLLWLLPVDALWAVAQVYTFGVKKYAAHNWAKGMKWSQMISAAKRHLTAFELGQDRDKESGLWHLAHLAFCILCLMAYQLRRVGDDDRFKLPNVDEVLEQLEADDAFVAASQIPNRLEGNPTNVHGHIEYEPRARKYYAAEG